MYEDFIKKFILYVVERDVQKIRDEIISQYEEYAFRSQDDRQKILRIASEVGDADIIRELRVSFGMTIENFRYDNSYCVKMIVQRNFCDALLELKDGYGLCSDDVRLNDNGSFVFKICCQRGYDRILNVLKNSFAFTLEDVRNNISCINDVCKNGFLNVLNELKNTYGIEKSDLTINNNLAFRIACEEKRAEVLKFLRIHFDFSISDLRDNNYSLLKNAIQSKNREIFEEIKYGYGIEEINLPLETKDTSLSVLPEENNHNDIDSLLGHSYLTEDEFENVIIFVPKTGYTLFTKRSEINEAFINSSKRILQCFGPVQQNDGSMWWVGTDNTQVFVDIEIRGFEITLPLENILSVLSSSTYINVFILLSYPTEDSFLSNFVLDDDFISQNQNGYISDEFCQKTQKIISKFVRK